MKCYRHPNVDAVGVCYECGKGLCAACAISVRGRLYCQTDVDALLAPERRDSGQDDKRPAAITLASILFVLYGVGELALSILLMYYGVVPGSFNNPLRFFPFSSSVSLIDTTVSLAPFITGGILFVASMIGILSGDWLWSRKRSGAVLGFVQIAVGTVLAITLIGFNRSSVAYDILPVVLGLNVALAILTIAGRRSLS